MQSSLRAALSNKHCRRWAFARRRSRRGKTARDSFLSMRSLRASLKRTDPDVILCNGIKAGTLGVPIGRLLGIPTVWCKHDFVFDRSLGVGVSALADAVIATSDELVA